MRDQPTKPSGVFQAFGWLHCPSCNVQKRPSTEIAGECAWCWDAEEKRNLRYVKPDHYKEWQDAYGPLDGDEDIPTSPESRQALEHPPALDKIPDTDPTPAFVPPIKREEDD